MRSLDMLRAVSAPIRWFFFLALSLGVIFALPLDLRQPASYVDFADTSAVLSIPNGWNVLSNLGFLIVGAIGCAIVWKRREDLFEGDSEVLPWLILFGGTFLTAFGSAWFHLRPFDVERLVWDRLPMTIGFSGFLGVIMNERLGRSIGTMAMGVLMPFGFWSVGYWCATDRLWPYAAFQLYAFAGVLLMILLFPPRYTRGGEIAAALVLYGAAKLLEDRDRAIYLATRGVISGHPLKHVIAAVGAGMVLHALVRREAKGERETLKAKRGS